MEQDFIRSGSTLLDLVLGGGYALGRVVNIVGDSSSGKSLLAIEAAANFARQFPDARIRYVDTEAAFNPEYAEAVGFPADGNAEVLRQEEGLETIEGFFDWMGKELKGGKQTLIILDSLDGLSDKDELEREASDTATYAMRKPKVISAQLRKYVNVISKSKSVLLIISQTRDKIGVAWGNPKTRAGGKALRFYSSQEIWLSVGKKLKRQIQKHDRAYGVLIKVKSEKNRFAACPRECELELHYNFGIEDLNSCSNFLGEKVVNRLIQKGDSKGYKEALEVKRKQVVKMWNDIEEKSKPKMRKYG